MEPGGAAVTALLGTLHMPFHILGPDSEFVLERGPRPQRRGLLVLGNADALALQVFRPFDAGGAADQHPGVEEAP